MIERTGSFTYDLRREDGEAVVRLSGELDLDSAPELAQCLEQLGANGVAAVVVDLSGLEFCDSSGLNVFVRFEKHAREQGSRLVLRAPSPAVERLLTITQLDGLLEVRRP